MPTASVRETDFYYEVAGEGDPVVLAPGGFLDHTSWMLVVPLLASSFRVITYDPQGHGQSTGSLQGDPIESVDDFAAFIEALGIAPAHFVGVSGGGAVVLHLAARRPELLRSVSVHEPAVLALLTGAAAAEAQEMFSYTARKLREGEIEEGLRAFFTKVGADWSLVPQPFRLAILHNAASYGEWFGDLSHPIWNVEPAALSDLGPIQLTRGDQSPALMQEAADRFAAAIPDAEVAIIEGAGHTPMFDQPARYADTLKSFFQRETRGASAV